MDWLFYALISYYAWSINDNIKTMAVSISDLNKQMVIQITEAGFSKTTIQDHELRIRKLESP